MESYDRVMKCRKNVTIKKRIPHPICEKYRRFIEIQTQYLNDRKVLDEEKRKRVQELNLPVWKSDSIIDTTVKRFGFIYEKWTSAKVMELFSRISDRNEIQMVINKHSNVQISQTQLLEEIETFYYDDTYYGFERLIWIDKFSYICYITVKPYKVDQLYVFQETPLDYWMDVEDETWEIIADKYYEQYSKRIIYRALLPWLIKPRTNDGKDGLYVMCGYNEAKRKREEYETM